MRKYTLLLAIVSMFSLSSYAQSLRYLTDADVLSIAMADYSPSNTNYALFVGNTNEKFTNTNNTLFNYLQNGTPHNAVVYIDEEPDKGWDHSCVFYYIPRYVPSSYTNNSGIPFYRVDASRPRGDYTFTSYSTIFYGNISMPNVETLYTGALRAQDAAHTYAIIFNGGLNKCANYPRYWNDCALVYQTLTRRFGIPSSNISVLMADGTSSSDDMVYGTGSFMSSPTDLDGDNVADIDMAGTLANLQSELQRLAGIMTTNDNLFIYTTGPGGVSGTSSASSSYIWTWYDNDEQRIFDYELTSLLNSFNVNSINIVMQQNSAGGFIDNVQGTGRVVTASCGQQEQCYVRTAKDYDEFTYHWACAINERNLSSGSAVSSDANGDGYVTMGEAFNYANQNDTQSETPQISPTASNATLAFNIRPIGYELIIRDATADIGGDNTGLDYQYWASPDVWIRAQADGLTYQYNQIIPLTGTSQIFHNYVRITNIGNKPYSSSDQYLHPYWAMNMLGQTASQWQGYTGEGGSLSPMCITSSIQPGSSIIVEYNWSVPDLLWQSVVNAPGHYFSQLMVLSPSSSQNITLPTIASTGEVNVMGYGNIAQNCTIVLEANYNNDSGGALYIRNTTSGSRNYSIEIVPVGNVDDVEVGLRVSGRSSTAQVRLSDGGGSLCDISLDGGQTESLYFTCRYAAADKQRESEASTFDIILRDQQTGTVVGGQRVIVVRKAEIAAEARTSCAIRDIACSPDMMTVTLSAPACKNTIVRLSPITGLGQAIEKKVDAGQTEASVAFDGMKSEICLVTLLQDGAVTDNRKVMIR